ncbi:MAG: hypothetical protein GY834_12880 [Bacteroidetes bacterium]|nr:hypothetical protein [Bacteroidota bacterium]
MENKYISSDELAAMLETHMHAFITQEKYTIKSVSSMSLFSYNRLDLAIKLLYLDGRRYNDKFSSKIYDEHIRSISLGSFKEPGNEKKTNLETFIGTFNELYSSIREIGFDARKSLIPISQNGTIINGAHRVACAIALDKPLKCVKLDTQDHFYDCKFFFNRGMEPKMLDAAATKFIETGANVYIAIIWPSAKGSLHNAESNIPNVIYKKQVYLNANGGANFISIIYQGCNWLGNSSQGYPGVNAKLVECFANANPVTAIAFQAPTLAAVHEIKSKIRNIFKIGKHSIHVTDTKEEAVIVAHMLFNDNAVHFLNYAKPRTFQSTFEKIEKFKCFLKHNELNKDELVLDGGIVLSLYGLREADDIDYLYIGGDPIIKVSKNVNHHQDSLKYYEVSEKDLVMDPGNYFYFDGIKFLSFSRVYQLKESRGHTKDKNDILLMRGLVENDRYLARLGLVKQKITFAYIRLYHRSLNMLQTIGLYNAVRWLYRKIIKTNVV